MSAKSITVVATFEARRGKEEELRKALLTLVAHTHKEAGCLNYDLHVLPEDPTKFLFHENWTSKELLDAHLNSVHIAALLPRLDELCVAFPEIKVWQKIS
jgi:quinol monooxygenase YgiN